jgi:pimeloyl-ACP methyl ester carboxylesterase
MEHSRLFGIRFSLWSTWALAILLSATFSVAATAAAKTITVGSLTLKFCDSDFNGYCGSIKRPLDPTGGVTGKITIAFVYYPRFDQDQPALGTLLPQEGGPGYSTRGTASAYLNIYGSLRNRRDVLIVDKRGTGLSDAVDCPAIQTGDPADPEGLEDCGEQLGQTAPLYGTKLAVDDIVAVMDALQVQDVDYYGDSYGTYVGQVFAAWHPDRLRSIILDSAYPVRAPDVWFPTDWTTGRDGLNLVCNRTPACASLGGSATDRLDHLLRELRQHSISGTAPDADGTPTQVTLDVSTLFLLVTNLGASPITYRDLDSATRAWFNSHDAVPLLRLAAEYNTPSVSDPVDFSDGQYQAVICGEYPLLYNLSASPAKRRLQYAKSLEEAREDRPDLFAPFTIDEAIAAN